MASAAAINNTSQRRKGKRPSPLDSTDADTFDNPLASPDSTESARNDFTAGGGELAEYGEGYDDKFSSSQIFQKLETEASVSP